MEALQAQDAVLQDHIAAIPVDIPIAIGQEDGELDEDGELEDDLEDDDDDEEEEDEGFTIPDFLLHDGLLLEDPLDPRRMLLSNQEREWALAIKRAIVGSDELDNMSDFNIAQLAMVDKGDVEAAVERATRMQAFREEYQVTNTLESGIRDMRKLLEIFPGAFLSFSYSTSHGSYCLVYDLAAFDLEQLTKNPSTFEAGLRGSYYLNHCLMPDFQAMRRGAIFLVECQGFDWKKNMDLKTIRRIWQDYLLVYPFAFQRIKYFHSGLFINMINSMKKKFLPIHIVERMETGCMFEERLSNIYLVPNLAAASERLIACLELALRRRYDNEMSFSLDA